MINQDLYGYDCKVKLQKTKEFVQSMMLAYPNMMVTEGLQPVPPVPDKVEEKKSGWWPF